MLHLLFLAEVRTPTLHALRITRSLLKRILLALVRIEVEHTIITVWFSQEVENARLQVLQARKERETAALSAARLARREARAVRLEVNFGELCPALLLPHAQKHLRKISDALEPHGEYPVWKP